MVQAQGVYSSSGTSAQVTVDGTSPTMSLPIIIGLGILGIVVAAVILKK